MFDDDNCKNHHHPHLYLYLYCTFHKLRFKSEFWVIDQVRILKKVLCFKCNTENNEVIILRKR